MAKKLRTLFELAAVIVSAYILYLIFRVYVSPTFRVSTETLLGLQGLLSIVVGVIAARVLSNGVRRITEGLGPEWSNNLSRVVWYASLAIVLMATLAATGIEPQTLLLGGALVTIVATIAAQQLITGFIAGVMILANKVLAVNELIQIDGEYMKVRGLKLLSVEMEKLDGSRVLIPNSIILSSKVTKLQQGDKLNIPVKIQVKRGIQPAKVMKLIEEVTKSTGGLGLVSDLSSSPTPVFMEQTPFAQIILVRLVMSEADFPATLNEFNSAMEARLIQEGLYP